MTRQENALNSRNKRPGWQAFGVAAARKNDVVAGPSVMRAMPHVQTRSIRAFSQDGSMRNWLNGTIVRDICREYVPMAGSDGSSHYLQRGAGRIRVISPPPGIRRCPLVGSDPEESVTAARLSPTNALASQAMLIAYGETRHRPSASIRPSPTPLRELKERGWLLYDRRDRA